MGRLGARMANYNPRRGGSEDANPGTSLVVQWLQIHLPGRFHCVPSIEPPIWTIILFFKNSIKKKILAQFIFYFLFCHTKSFFFFNFPRTALFIYFNWRLITLQYCSSFCHTLTWISLGCTCVPQPESPSHFPPHPIPQGHPSAPLAQFISKQVQSLVGELRSHMLWGN